MRKLLPYLHPFCFALYPIFELRNYNITYVDLASLARPVLLSVLLTALLWVILRFITRNWQTSGIITTLAVISFFSYGHVFLQIESGFGTLIRHRHLVMIFGVILLLAAIYILWKVNKPEGLVNFLTVTGGILALFSIARSLQYDYSVYRSAQEWRELQNSYLKEVSDPGNTTKPDIYVILLDAHTSDYILRKDFDYNNSEFTRQLTDLGLYVAECAQSNYPVTKLSVTSLFYANYHLEPTLYPLYSSLVIETVRSQGYRVITFENRSNGHFSFAEDIRLSRNQLLAGKVDLTGGPSEFEFELLETSLARIAFDIPGLIPGFDLAEQKQTEFYEHYQQTFFILDELKRLPEVEGPKLVFAHFLVPHSPFIFSPDGEFQWADDPQWGYLSNVEFIDSQIVPVVAEIIEKSEVPPIIVIMGDHGATGVPDNETPQMRMSILNAYYVNDQAKQDLYATITPVNSFRVIFNNYFGTDYPLLEDVSYHASKFEDFTPEFVIANECQASP